MGSHKVSVCVPDDLWFLAKAVWPDKKDSDIIRDALAKAIQDLPVQRIEQAVVDLTHTRIEQAMIKYKGMAERSSS